MIHAHRPVLLIALALVLALLVPAPAQARTVILLPLEGSILEERGGLVLGFCDDVAKTQVDVTLNGKPHAVELWDGVFDLDLDWAPGKNVLAVGGQTVTFVSDPYAQATKAPLIHQAASDNCGNCHILGVDRSLTLRANAVSLCLGCHQKKVGAFGHGTVSCDKCHLPHSSWEPHLLKSRGNGICLGCHAQRTAEKDPAHGALWTKTACTTCHRAHQPASRDLGDTCGACHRAVTVATPAHADAARRSCNTCHRMHATKEQGHRKPPVESCAGCHPPKTDKDHQKVVADCGSCHGIHRAKEKGNQEAACRPCHEPIFAKERLHGPESVGDCAVCHPVHNLPNLSPAFVSCTQCHGSEKLKSEHTGALVAFNSCSICHRLHTSEEPAFLARFRHTVVRKRRCPDCHGNPGFGSDRKYVGPWGPLCLTCHEAKRPTMSHHPAAEGQCQECHDPHGSLWENQLTRSPQKLCRPCHEAVGNSLKGEHAELDCSECHDPHGGAQEHHLVKPVGALCTTCHSDPTLDLGGVAKATIHGPLNTGGCTLCHDAHGGSAGKNLRMPEGELCQSCHEPYTPKELGKRGGRIHAPVARGDCAACHEPHASRGKALLKDTGNSLCRRCHDPKRHSHALGPRGTSTFTIVPADWPRDGVQFACTSCHRPHSSPMPRLLAKSRAELCRACHKGV